jgi:hypothetical protein
MMLDLVNERNAALTIYKELAMDKSRIGEIAEKFLNKAYERPVQKK